MKYRKKPVVVEAYQTDREMIIHTLEGDMRASAGDYIITGVNGEQYPCKPDIFEKTYEVLENDEKPDYQPYGYVRFIPDEVLEDETLSDVLESEKLFVLEKIIAFMRREAAENPDFFIVNREVCGDPLSRNSVGLKVYLPKRRYGEWQKAFVYSRGQEDHYRIACPYCRYVEEVTCVGDKGMEDKRFCPRCGVRLGGGN